MPDKQKLRPFQERVASLILDGKSVILRAPTGAGKTRAAMLPFVQGTVSEKIQFPGKAIYSVPMRVLANQFFADYDELVEKRGYRDQISVSIQTGDRPEWRHT